MILLQNCCWVWCWYNYENCFSPSASVSGAAMGKNIVECHPFLTQVYQFCFLLT